MSSTAKLGPPSFTYALSSLRLAHRQGEVVRAYQLARYVSQCREYEECKALEKAMTLEAWAHGQMYLSLEDYGTSKFQQALAILEGLIDVHTEPALVLRLQDECKMLHCCVVNALAASTGTQESKKEEPPSKVGSS